MREMVYRIQSLYLYVYTQRMAVIYGKLKFYHSAARRQNGT